MVLELKVYHHLHTWQIILMRYYLGLDDEKRVNILLLCHNLFVSLLGDVYILMEIFKSAASAITPPGFKLSYIYLIMCTEK